MANQITNFYNGSLLAVYINSVNVAYCQGVSFTENITNVPVSQMGSYGVSAVEPTMYALSGDMRILRWNSDLWEQGAVPENLETSTMAAGASIGGGFVKGNGLVDYRQLSPLHLLLSQSFDIKIFGRKPTVAVADSMTGNKSTTFDITGDATYKTLYTIEDCRLSNYSFGFMPGSLLTETLGFQALNVVSH